MLVVFVGLVDFDDRGMVEHFQYPNFINKILCVFELVFVDYFDCSQFVGETFAFGQEYRAEAAFA